MGPTRSDFWQGPHRVAAGLDLVIDPEQLEIVGGALELGQLAHVTLDHGHEGLTLDGFVP